jgi:hypothetical protein
MAFSVSVSGSHSVAHGQDAVQSLSSSVCRACLWTVIVPAPGASVLFSFFSRGRADLSGLLSDSPKQILFYCFSSRAGVADLGFHSTQPLFLQPPSPFACPC